MFPSPVLKLGRLARRSDLGSYIRLSRLNADGRVDLNIASAAAGVTRHYDDPAVIKRDAVNARVWSGIHFRTADEVSAVIGTHVANWTLDHYFARTK